MNHHSACIREGGPRGRTTEHVPRSLRAWRPADGREMEWNQSDGTGELARKLACTVAENDAQASREPLVALSANLFTH